MNVAGLRQTREQWKDIMREEPSSLDLLDIVLSVKLS
jgi:hypothetical protein